MMIYVGVKGENSNFVHGGNIYSWAREAKSNLAGILDFSANINPLGLAANVHNTLIESVGSIIHYPDPEAIELKSAISSHYKIDTNQIIAGNGAVELLYVFTHTIRPRRVLIPAPAFSEYERASRAAGAEIEYAILSPEDNFSIDVEKMIKCLNGIDVVFIGNPNNPTGTLLRVGEIERIVKAATQTGTMVIVDESFMDFIKDDFEYTCRPLLKEYSNLMIIHSLTKFYAIPGLRLGFALTNPVLASKLHLAKDPWNVNSLAQAAGITALKDEEYQENSREMIAEEKDLLFSELQHLPGIKPFPPSVNYILIDAAGTGLTAQEIRAMLSKEAILIRDCSNYPGLSPYYLRVAVKLREQNKILVKKLSQVAG